MDEIVKYYAMEIHPYILQRVNGTLYTEIIDTDTIKFTIHAPHHITFVETVTNISETALYMVSPSTIAIDILAKYRGFINSMFFKKVSK